MRIHEVDAERAEAGVASRRASAAQGRPAPMTKPFAESQRLFVALAPSEASRALLAREIRRIETADSAARPSRIENVHWTVAFLGPTLDDEIPAIEAALRVFAREVAPFSLRIAGLGSFPTGKSPRVVWAGVETGNGAARMAELARRLSVVLSAIGHPVDDAARFRPHLTLARLDGPPRGETLKELLTTGTLQDTYSPEVLSDLLFMVSENDGRGTRYRPLTVIPLGAR
jgi:RNA 2',3'-cyclic 3'-phosphodiesterase